MRSIFPQPRSTARLDGEACARLFEAQQRAARRHQPIDAYVKHHEELLAQLQATVDGNHAILAAFMEIINSEEPMARQELEASYDRITASMLSRQHTPDEARARQNILQRQQTVFAKKLRGLQRILAPLQAKQEANIRTQRQAEADRLRAHHQGYKPALIQRCPVTGILFNIDTLESYSAPQIEWLSPAEWQKHQASRGN